MCFVADFRDASPAKQSLNIQLNCWIVGYHPELHRLLAQDSLIDGILKYQNAQSPTNEILRLQRSHQNCCSIMNYVNREALIKNLELQYSCANCWE
ncbi:MAG: hypothetical protein HEQ35_31135 [Gloeotrichia echinulata IR180]|nr:hypothetical protein [Gloeotrichia echinulata DEX184]